MDVKKRTANSEIDEYINWLEIALRAQVVCNVAFTRKFDRICRYIRSQAQGYLRLVGIDDPFRGKFQRLVSLRLAVAGKYNVLDIAFIRSQFDS